MIELKQLDFSYTNQPFMKNVSIQFIKGHLTSIIGANGSGKSTLLMLMSKILHEQSGEVFIEGKDIQTYTLKDFAKQVAVVHQKNNMQNDAKVETLVGYGRLPYLSYMQRLSSNDYEIIEWALEVTGLLQLRHANFKTLSGGQQQRVWIAMALAQKTPILLLDEPTTYLDIKYQVEILNLIKKINKEYHMTIVMVHHDINQALHYSDDIIAMRQGKILFHGPAHDVIHETSLRAVYDCEFQMIEHEGHKIVLNVAIT
ncbi:ABC transporter ATP-binding protein [Amedibacillus sp. YH-ame10]